MALRIAEVLAGVVVTGGAHVVLGRLWRGAAWWLLASAALVGAVVAARTSARALVGALFVWFAVHGLSIIDAALISRRAFLRPTAGAVIAALGVMFTVYPAMFAIARFVVLEPFIIPAGSMLPTIHVGDLVLVDRLAYLSRSPGRSDVIVFRYPNDRRKLYVKRVAALGGDVVDFRDGVMYLNGNRIESSLEEKEVKIFDKACIPEPMELHRETLDGQTFKTVRVWYGSRDSSSSYAVPQGHLFVLGDNRDNSQDSRTGFTVPIEDVKGRARWILFSWNACDTAFRAERFGLQIQ